MIANRLDRISKALATGVPRRRIVQLLAGTGLELSMRPQAAGACPGEGGHPLPSVIDLARWRRWQRWPQADLLAAIAESDGSREDVTAKLFEVSADTVVGQLSFDENGDPADKVESIYEATDGAWAWKETVAVS